MIRWLFEMRSAASAAAFLVLTFAVLFAAVCWAPALVVWLLG
jgi:hypothetical protein